MKRNCEICGNKNNKLIYVQKFILTDSKEPTKHRITHCPNCGFVFVFNKIQQKKLDVYYKKNNKYLYLNQNTISPELNAFHKIFFDFINNFFVKKYSKKNYKNKYILDVGCGNGNLLNLFKNYNYKKILGIDPSKECALWAKKYFNIKIITSTINEYNTNKKFDVIILAAVLEHLADLNKSLIKMTKLLKNDGLLITLVPDLSKFGKIMKEPFLEFSLEHINFFTKNSLSNFLGKYGYKLIDNQSLRAEYFESYALASIWQKSDAMIPISKDDSSLIKLKKYISISQKKLKKVEKKINKIVVTKEPVIVWGTGSLTARLLGTTKFGKMNIIEFLDKNTSLQGKKIIGKLIRPPQSIKGKKTTIFISSFIYGNEIKNNLIKDYNYKGKIILI